MAKINETNYPRRQASEYASTDMFIVQPGPDPEQEHSGDSRTTRVSDLKEYMLGNADPSKIGTPAAGTYTSASNTNAQNIAALDHALANYDHLTKQIATQAEINGYIADPTTADFNVIYLLKDTSATGSDKYFEYQRLGTAESSTFEMTGDTSTDLSDYYTKSEVNTALGNKADKVSGAVSGNFAGLDANGNLIDSGNKASDFLTQHQDITGKADKVSNPTSGNFAGLDSNGNLIDSGKAASDFVASNGGESGDTIVTFTDPSADGTITSGSALKTIIGLIKYKLAHITGGGHTILNGSGLAMAQRGKLQFVGATVTDDGTNDKTVVSLGTTVSVTHTLSASANTNFDFTGIGANAVITEVLATDGRGYASREYINSGTGIRFVFAPDSSTPTVTMQIRYR